MGEQHTRLEAFLKNRISRPGDQEIGEVLLRVADACDAAIESGALSSEQLRLLVEGASHPNALVWDGSTGLFVILEKKGFDVAGAFLEMSKHPKAHVRFAAMCCLSKATPLDVVDKILQAGLADKSAEVRWKAAEQAWMMHRTGLEPAVSAALAIEKNQRVRASIEDSLAALRDIAYARKGLPST